MHAVLPGELELPMIAESNESFYFENYNTVFRFMKNKKGISDKVITHEHGKDIEANKVK